MKSCGLQHMDGYWNHYTKWNKSDIDFSNMWNLKEQKQMNKI